MIIQGKIYIFSAPSGAGKSSLIQELIKTQHNTQISVSHTTRIMRPEETHGKQYFFISVAEFEHMITEDAFLEYAKVFGNYYGTLQAPVEQKLATGIDLFLDIDWQGAQQIRQKITNVHSIFILPPSKKELTRRLRKRGQDSELVIARRMAQAVKEMNHLKDYDYLIINNDFHTALLDLKSILQAEQLRLEWQKKCHQTLINKLLAD